MTTEQIVLLAIGCAVPICGLAFLFRGARKEWRDAQKYIANNR
jgi:hypothetical protein